MAIFSKRSSADDEWQTHGRQVFTLLQAYAMAVGGLRSALDPQPGALLLPDPQGMQQGAADAHNEFYAALQTWVRRHAPRGGPDPSRGGFAALSTAIQDAYQAASLSHLTTLGLTGYVDRVQADGRLEEVLAADRIAIGWYNAAAAFADTILTTGQPRGSRFVGIYTESVYKPYKTAAAAYGSLQPYLDGFATKQA
jgi:hypothetical protein